MASRFHVHIWSVSLLAVLAGGALAATVQATHAGRRSEPSPLLSNVQAELLRLGCHITLVPLPESTADHIYIDPPWNIAGEDPLLPRLQNRSEWQRDGGFIHRISHRGSNFGFREKRSPSLHISVYPRGPSYVYEMHYDRFLALGRTPIGSLKHIFGEVIPNGFLGKHTSQNHIRMLMQRTQDGARRGHSLD